MLYDANPTNRPGGNNLPDVQSTLIKDKLPRRDWMYHVKMEAKIGDKSELKPYEVHVIHLIHINGKERV